MVNFIRKKNTMKKIFFVIAVSIIVASCSKTDSVLPVTTVAELNTKNVAYATADPLENMDVYLPAGRSSATTNCIVVIHGGSWSSGDKTDMDSGIIALRPLLPAYAVFNINYRLANGTTILADQIVDDVNKAIDFIVNKSGEYKINANNIAIVGASAGGHLGMLKAYKYNADGRIKAMVDLFGPNDLTWMYTNHPFYLSLTQALLKNYIGLQQPVNPTLYQNQSPINYVTTAAPPTQILHGTADSVVPISESQRLDAKLYTKGVVHEYIAYTGSGHGDWDKPTWTNAYIKMAAFIKTYVP